MVLRLKLPRSFDALTTLVTTALLLFVSFQTSRSILDHVVDRVAQEEKSISKPVSLNNKVVYVKQKTPPKWFTKVPEDHRKTFFHHGGTVSRSAVRAFRSRGWTLVNKIEDAQIIIRYGSSGEIMKSLKPWQRFNHVPNHHYWNEKDYFAEEFQKYEERTGVVPYFLPESFLLESSKDRKAFKKRITREGGINHPWVLKEPNVNQGRGIEMIAPNSERLLEIANLKKDDDNGYIVQQYICNELTWNGRKFDVRMFWLVASIDPLIVLYQDGYARIGNGVYTEDDFDNTVSHLTTHTGLGEEVKADYDEFSQLIMQHYRSSPELAHIQDPVQHVKNQFKDSLAEFVKAFKDVSFYPDKKKLAAENAFGFYGADFILDNDLDVWLIEPQKGCGMDEDYDFRVDMHDRLMRGMVDTLEEIWIKQEEGNPVLPLENTGDWEVIYADGWTYSYNGYKRSKDKKGCSAPVKAKQVAK